jgi:hypothetical protein
VIIRAIYDYYGKEKVKNRVADPTKNNPHLPQRTEKNGGHCTGLYIYSFLQYSLRTLGEALLEKIY